MAGSGYYVLIQTAGRGGSGPFASSGRSTLGPFRTKAEAERAASWQRKASNVTSARVVKVRESRA